MIAFTQSAKQARQLEPALAPIPGSADRSSSQVEATASGDPFVPPASMHPPHTHASLLIAAQSLVYIIIVAVFIMTFSAQPFRIPSESMEPTLLVGDFLLVDKRVEPLDPPSERDITRIGADGRSIVPASLHIRSFTDALMPGVAIRRGDVVVFHYPVDASLHLVKRVVGMPGDRLRMRQGHVFIDGRALVEPYAVYRPGQPDGFRDNFPRLQEADPSVDSRWWITLHKLVDHGDLIIPEDSYFVLGDNRNDSEDSRYWGFVPRAAIVGRPLLIYFSLRPSALAAVSSSSDAGSDRQQPDPARNDPSTPFFNFARWDRVLRVVR